MTKKIVLVYISIALLVLACKSSTDSNQLGTFSAENEAFWEVVPRDAVAERIGIDFEFTEGPAILKDGSLIFSDIPANTIYEWTGRRYKVFRSPSYHSNGLLVLRDGSLLACEHGSRSIVRIYENGRVDTITSKYRGLRLNSPNDLCVSSDGTIYFTDPPWGLDGRNKDPEKEIPFSGVYRVSGGKTFLIDSTLSWPNGIALSPEDDYLYVADYEEAGPGPEEEEEVFWVRYTLDRTGDITAKDIIFRAENTGEPGGPDGMEIDRKGNLYVTGPGGILVLNPEGEHLGTIGLPEVPSNLVFGPNEKNLYVTARSMVLKIRINE